MLSSFCLTSYAQNIGQYLAQYEVIIIKKDMAVYVLSDYKK